jgi:hypothetical protein
MTTSQITPQASITDAEVDALNAARDAMAAIKARAANTYDGGMIRSTITHAEWLVFQVLNYSNVHGDRTLTDAQLHNTSAES